ncbi:MAG: invasion associated locus B family protein [Rhizomicrobium sp.]
MARIIAGSLLAIIFLGLLFAASRLLPEGIEGMTGAEIAQISPGFAGKRYIGPWVLVCQSRPQAGAAISGKTAGTNAKVGRCRMARAYQDKRGQVLLTLAFRYAGPNRELTLIVRFPPIGHKGQYVIFWVGPKSAIRIPVFGCTKESCVAVGALIPAAASLLAGAQAAKVVLPPGSDGKQYTVGIRLDELAPALAGMHRAEF